MMMMLIVLMMLVTMMMIQDSKGSEKRITIWNKRETRKISGNAGTCVSRGVYVGVRVFLLCPLLRRCGFARSTCVW